MKKVNLLIVFAIFSQIIIAQQPFYTNYTWEKSPNYKIEAGSEKPMIALKEKTATEFVFESGGLSEYFLEHNVLWLNADDKIEYYNKIYLPYSSSSELLISKARVVKKNGDIIELDDSKILTSQDEETGNNYKFFALEGVEKGSFIEYYYVIKRYPRYKGNKIQFQSSYDIENVEFDLYAPKNLIFTFKTYNNTPDVVLDTLTKDKLHWKLNLKQLKGLENEETSAYEASKSSVVYKLDRNTADNSKDISSYSVVAQNIYTYYYPEFSKKTQNSINKFISEATSDKKLEEEALIRKLEFYIKTNVFLTKDNSENFNDLDQVIAKKIANEAGIIKLYTSLFKTLNINHQIVITSNRQDLKFDKNFEANNFLTDFLIYFPKTKTYLSPTEIQSRYGFPPAYLTDNYGLFIKEVKVGTFVSGIGEIKYIKAITADNTIDKMILDVAFDADNISNSNIKLQRSMSGYYAMYFQPYIHLSKEDDRKELMEGFAKNINEDVTIVKTELINADPELFGIEPMQINVDFTSEAFTEKAGKKYLFKVGELIGKQIQLYQEKARVLPVENEFTRSYYRTININIPQGYKIANLNDINIDNSFVKDGAELLVFKSFYEMNGNILKITADEHYRENIIETANYESYRTVINSAADFNKLVLIFEPIE
jgi:Domain of Unknown Function with PDB structure (DUF3857)